MLLLLLLLLLRAAKHHCVAAAIVLACSRPKLEHACSSYIILSRSDGSDVSASQVRILIDDLNDGPGRALYKVRLPLVRSFQTSKHNVRTMSYKVERPVHCVCICGKALHGNGDGGNTAVTAGIPRFCR